MYPEKREKDPVGECGVSGAFRCLACAQIGKTCFVAFCGVDQANIEKIYCLFPINLVKFLLKALSIKAPEQKNNAERELQK